MSRQNRPSKHPDHGHGMIAALKRLGYFLKLTRAKERTTDSGHTVGKDVTRTWENEDERDRASRDNAD